MSHRRHEPAELYWQGASLYRRWLWSCDHDYIGFVARSPFPPFDWAIWQRGCCMGHRNDEDAARAELERFANKAVPPRSK